MKPYALVLLLLVTVPASVAAADDTTTAPIASTTTPKLRLAPYVWLVAGQGADAASTAHNFARGLHESNAVYGSQASLGKILAVKAGETAALALLIRHFEQTGHPKAAKVLGYVGGIGGFIPAAINLKARR